MATHLYPNDVMPLVEWLRQYIGHDNIVAAHAALDTRLRSATSGIEVHRLRERQQLLAAFREYDKATLRGTRALRRATPEIAYLAWIAYIGKAIAPRKPDSLVTNHRKRLLSPDGQLNPLILEWESAHYYKDKINASVDWYPVHAGEPEFKATVDGIEFDVECKLLTPMIGNLFGDAEADALAAAIIDCVRAKNLCGTLAVEVEPGVVADPATIRAWFDPLVNVGDQSISLAGVLQISSNLKPSGQVKQSFEEWRSSVTSNRPDARRFAYAAALQGGLAADPIVLDLSAARRRHEDLRDYLFEKFRRAAEQCPGTRGAVLSTEWAMVDDPRIFAESEGIQGILARLYDENRHIAAVMFRCARQVNDTPGVTDFSRRAYASTNKVTKFPEVAVLRHLDPA